MASTRESSAPSVESNPTPQEQAASSPDATAEELPFDIEEFVHAPASTARNEPAGETGGSIDASALSQLGGAQGAGRRLSRKERRAAKRALKRELKEKKAAARQAQREQRQAYRSVESQLKERDKELSSRLGDIRRRREQSKTVNDFIGYERMYQDGICELEEGVFSATLAFDDTAYHSVQDTQQQAMFANIAKLYDQFGPNATVQMAVTNTPLLREEIGSRRFFDPASQQTEEAKSDAAVFNEILNDKIREGVSNIRRTRTMTFAVSADDADDAARALSRIETQSSRIFNAMGSKAHRQNGTQRLAAIFSLLNPGKPFDFDYRRDVGRKIAATTKDYIAPATIDFKPEGRFDDCFRLDDGVWGQVLVMRRFGSELSDRALADVIDLPIPLHVTWFLQPQDKSESVAFVRSRQAWMDKEVIEEQRSAVSKGYDFTILPQELKYSKEEAEDLLDNLQNKNQRLYTFTGLVYTYAATKQQLDQQVMRIISTARQNSIEVSTYPYRQRRGLNSVLPLGQSYVEISRQLTTAEASILVPFATQELDDPNGNYYGQNKHSRNLVLCDRKRLASPMGFVCGKTGSGKGMFVKTEMTGTIFSNPTDEVFVIDRAGEYTEIARRYGGTVYDFGINTGTYLNPFDTTATSHMSQAEQLAFKIDVMLAQAGASAAESGEPFTQTDQSIITRCVTLAFQRAEERGDGKPPLLQDFYDILREQPERQASEDIALRYERFIQAPMDFFNRQSNMDWDSRIIDFNLRDIPESMLVFALINVCEAVRNRMYHNAQRGVRTWLYVEEMQSMFAYPTVLNYFSRFANEGRKFGLLLTGITQSATSMLSNEAAQSIVLNADFIMLLKQSPLDRMRWAELLNLSDQEEECIDESVDNGDGLLIAGDARIPIRGQFPQGNALYDLFSTNPNEKAQA